MAGEIPIIVTTDTTDSIPKLDAVSGALDDVAASAIRASEAVDKLDASTARGALSSKNYSTARDRLGTNAAMNNILLGTANDHMSKTEQILSRLSAMGTPAVLKAATWGGLAGLAGAGGGVYKYMEFQRNMIQTITQAGVSMKNLPYLMNAALSISMKTGDNLKDIAATIYRVASGTASWNKGLGATKQQIASLAMGVTKFNILGNVPAGSSEQTSRVLTAFINSNMRGIGGPNSRGVVNRADALLNAAIGVGDIRPAELISALGRGALVSSKIAGLSAKDSLSWIDLLTTLGTTGSVAGTYVRTGAQLLVNATTQSATAQAMFGIKPGEVRKMVTGKGGLEAAVAFFNSKIARFAPLGKFPPYDNKGPGGRQGAINWLEHWGVGEIPQSIINEWSKGEKSKTNPGGLSVSGENWLRDWMFTKMFGGSRQMTPMAALLNNPGLLKGIETKMASNDTQKAYARDVRLALNTPQQQFHRAVATFNVDLLNVGKALTPVFLKLVKAGTDFFTFLTHNTPLLQGLGVALAGLLAVAGISKFAKFADSAYAPFGGALMHGQGLMSHFLPVGSRGSQGTSAFSRSFWKAGSGSQEAYMRKHVGIKAKWAQGYINAGGDMSTVAGMDAAAGAEAGAGGSSLGSAGGMLMKAATMLMAAADRLSVGGAMGGGGMMGGVGGLGGRLSGGALSKDEEDILLAHQQTGRLMSVNSIQDLGGMTRTQAKTTLSRIAQFYGPDKRINPMGWNAISANGRSTASAISNATTDASSALSDLGETAASGGMTTGVGAAAMGMLAGTAAEDVVPEVASTGLMSALGSGAGSMLGMLGGPAGMMAMMMLGPMMTPYIMKGLGGILGSPQGSKPNIAQFRIITSHIASQINANRRGKRNKIIAQARGHGVPSIATLLALDSNRAIQATKDPNKVASDILHNSAITRLLATEGGSGGYLQFLKGNSQAAALRSGNNSVNSSFPMINAFPAFLRSRLRALTQPGVNATYANQQIYSLLSGASQGASSRLGVMPFAKTGLGREELNAASQARFMKTHGDWLAHNASVSWAHGISLPHAQQAALMGRVDISAMLRMLEHDLKRSKDSSGDIKKAWHEDAEKLATRIDRLHDVEKEITQGQGARLTESTIQSLAQQFGLQTTASMAAAGMTPAAFQAAISKALNFNQLDNALAGLAASNIARGKGKS